MHADGATDGNTGLELALNNEYDLILLDVMLPGINGFEICKKIRETIKGGWKCIKVFCQKHRGTVICMK